MSEGRAGRRFGLSRIGGSISGATQPVAARVAIAGVAGALLVAFLLLRLWALTVMSGSEYAQLAEQNQLRRLAVAAPRGAIIDRDGRPLVANRAAREVVLNLSDVPEERRPVLYQDLARTLGMTVADVRERADRGAVDPLTPTVIAGDVQDNEVLFYLEEHADEFPGIDVRNRYVRSYVGGSMAAHVLGQVGEVGPEQLTGDFAQLKAGDHVGKSGVERTYDEYLRGTDGYRAVEVDATGVRQGDGRGVPATPGRNLKLSIDGGLQEATEDALREGVGLARSSADGSGSRANAGAAVALDPRTGAVLSMASYPSYDPNIFVTSGHDTDVRRILKDRNTPLSNRAIGGLYPPGSTYKVITGIAALQEGFIAPGSLLPCPSSMEIAGTRFNNWMDTPLPAMDLARALEVSCDTYFYRLALQFYNMPGSRLQEWSSRFGLGRDSGIDLPGESAGTIPTPEWRRSTFDGVDAIWSPGHSVNLSIGQGDLLVTPLQMTRVFAAIANGGTLFEPRIGMSVEDPSGRTVRELPLGSSTTIPLTGEQLRAVKAGLLQATHGSMGTGSAVFSTFPVDVAGKTGTAEKPPYGDMAWFCGYAPAAAPVIASCAIIENGGHGGTSAAPVVLRMMQEYFDAEGGNARGAKTD